MHNHLFVKQTHKNVKVAFTLFYMMLLIIIIIMVNSVIDKHFHWGFIVFLGITLILIIYLTKLFESFGIYLCNDKIYYKTIKTREIDVNKIVGIKIIKSEAKVNIAYPPFTLKDNNGKTLYSMIFLSKIEDEMKNYPYGDIEFLREYKKNVIMYSIYDKEMTEYFQEHKGTVLL